MADFTFERSSKSYALTRSIWKLCPELFPSNCIGMVLFYNKITKIIQLVIFFTSHIPRAGIVTEESDKSTIATSPSHAIMLGFDLQRNHTTPQEQDHGCPASQVFDNLDRILPIPIKLRRRLHAVTTE
jgi:hypothetical protein